MPINILEESTVAALGSTQHLLDPCSLVKELIENAYDARASSIFIEISANTTDVVQVRDNGHGIPPEDRRLIGRPHCTSKLNTIEELEFLGGTTFGFRGEALANAVNMSAQVSVTTKCEGEAVGASWIITQDGEDTEAKPTSHPAGTTIRVTDFLQHLPVRRQIAVNETSKTLGKIKSMLCSYALARRNVRLNFKVLKANDGKLNWSYAPPTRDSLEESAIGILGSAAVGECSYHQSSTNAVYQFKSLLPRCDADPKKISAKGAFISVDGRPIIDFRNTIKELRTKVRQCLSHGLQLEKGQKISNPIIVLDITCPPGSYDPNIEPAKDDLMFFNPEVLLSEIKDLLQNVYGQTLLEDRLPASSPFPNREPAYVFNDTEVSPIYQSPRYSSGNASLSLRRTRVKHLDLGSSSDSLSESNDHFQNSAGHGDGIFKIPSTPAQKIKSSPSSALNEADDFDDILTIRGSPQPEDPLGQDRYVSASTAILNNPWTKAKLNASMSYPRSTPNMLSMTQNWAKATVSAQKIGSQIQKKSIDEQPSPTPKRQRPRQRVIAGKVSKSNIHRPFKMPKASRKAATEPKYPVQSNKVPSYFASAKPTKSQSQFVKTALPNSSFTPVNRPPVTQSTEKFPFSAGFVKPPPSTPFFEDQVSHDTIPLATSINKSSGQDANRKQTKLAAIGDRMQYATNTKFSRKAESSFIKPKNLSSDSMGSSDDISFVKNVPSSPPTSPLFPNAVTPEKSRADVKLSINIELLGRLVLLASPLPGIAGGLDVPWTEEDVKKFVWRIGRFLSGSSYEINEDFILHLKRNLTESLKFYDVEDT